MGVITALGMGLSGKLNLIMRTELSAVPGTSKELKKC